MYNPMYAFINQFHFNKTRHPAIPFADNDVKPNINITIYIPTKKKRHWKIKLQNPLTLGLIPNHPEINTKTLTQTIDSDSKKNRKNALAGVDMTSS